MFQHVFFAQHLRKNVGVLLDDARIRNHINHALQIMFHRMRQGERQRGNRLAAACRHGQRVQPPLVLSAVQTARQNRTSFGAKVVGRRFKPRRDMGIQLFQKTLQRFPLSARLSALNRRFRIQIIRIHQARKQHAGVHRQTPRVFFSFKPGRITYFLWNFDFIFPRGWIVSACQGLVQPRPKRSAAVIRPAAHIRQTAVMARHGKRRNTVFQFPCQLRACRRVIHLGRVFRIALPFLPVVAVFADVVQQPRSLAMRLRAECFGKFSGQSRDILLVRLQRLVCSIRFQMRYIRHLHFLLTASAHRPAGSRFARRYVLLLNEMRFPNCKNADYLSGCRSTLSIRL